MHDVGPVMPIGGRRLVAAAIICVGGCRRLGPQRRREAGPSGQADPSATPPSAALCLIRTVFDLVLDVRW